MEDTNTVNVEMTPEVNTGRSKVNTVATGFCLTGAALSIGRAVYSGAKWVKGKILDRKKEETEYDVIEETEE